MAGLAEQMLRQAIESVLTRDSTLAQLVVATDDKIDLFENEIESLCIQLIALHQTRSNRTPLSNNSDEG